MKKNSDPRLQPPACRLMELLGTRWALPVLTTLHRCGTLRFNELQRAVDGNVSERMLASTLDSLETEGLVTRTVLPEVPPRVEYRITPKAGTIIPVLLELRETYEHSGGRNVE